MRKYTGKRLTRCLTAMTLTLALALTGCGSGNDPANPGGGSGDTHAVTPASPKPEAGITNLSADVTRVEIPETAMTGDHGSALSRSGFLLLDQVMETSGDRNANYLISPISLQMALGMTVTGADAGTATEKELMAVLMPGLEAKPETLNGEMATFAARMQSAEGVSWNVANSVWVRNDRGVTLRDTYISDVTNSYAAELYSAPFDQDTLDAINGWVKQQTRERIPKILERLDEDAALVLVNALAFDGEWMEKYEEDKIRESTFTNADGTETKINLLYSKEDAALLLEGGVGLIRPYKGGEYSFVAILPPDGMTAAEYLSKIAQGGSGFSEAFLNPARAKEVNAAIPEFKVEFGAEMDQVLKNMGVEEAYSNAAHFRSMLTENSPEVKIGTVVHKTMIQVDRAGTVAAASTAVEMRLKSAAPSPAYQVILDRPFVYGIVDNATGVPVFLGIQNTMADSAVTE